MQSEGDSSGIRPLNDENNDSSLQGGDFSNSFRMTHTPDRLCEERESATWQSHKHAKRASLTIEIGLSVVLAVLAIFVAFGMFGDTLSSMAANSGLNRLFHRNVTHVSDWGNDPTATIVQAPASQENLQLTGDQGLTLEQYVKSAQDAVTYYSKMNKSSMSNAQLKDLAKALTILAVNAGAQLPQSDAINYETNYGIRVTINPRAKVYETSLNDRPIIVWNKDEITLSYASNGIKSAIISTDIINQ